MSPAVVDALATLVLWTDRSALVYLLLLNTGYALLLVMSIPELWKHWRLSADEHLRRLLSSEALPPLSLLVPAHNEEVTIASSVLSFLTLEYPHLEVVVVNDGSRDRTMDVMMREFDLYEVPPAFPVRIATKQVRAYYRSRRHARLLVLDKENGGKADALNAAMNSARHPFVVAVDADTLIEPDALVRLARPFLLGANVAAVGGTIRVANNCVVELGRVVEARVDSRWLGGCQTVEYLRAFLFGRLAWNWLGGNLLISGAFGLFRKQYLFAIGGYRTGNVTEDMDLCVRLQRYLHEHGIEAELPFIPDPVAWTEVPSDLRVLRRQRERWHRGLIGTMLAHRVMLFNPRYRAAGMLAYPFFFFGEMLAPLVELVGWVGLALGLSVGLVDRQFALLFLAVAVGFGTLLSVWAIVLEEASFRRYGRPADLVRLIWYAVIEGLGYRQMTVLFRLQGFYNFLRGNESWGRMTRAGIGTAKKAA
ncbi:MAG: glycosyltransferase family 2 protein [Gemmatimonadaceae bacterium]|nr:glycosyltransferase family 2 protein [Gemmatimonadaceae bacterium]